MKEFVVFLHFLGVSSPVEKAQESPVWQPALRIKAVD